MKSSIRLVRSVSELKRSILPGYKSIPDHIIEEIKLSTEERFQIGATRTVDPHDIAAGKLDCLGVSLSGSDVTTTSPFLPPPTTRWAKWNVNGRSIPRDDWPKQTRSWTTTSPNFGDGARFGYNTQQHSRDVRARQTLHGKGFAFSVSATRLTSGKISVRALLEPEFSRAIDLDSPDLLMAVSLTREFVGTPHVLPTNASTDHWEEEQGFNWEFLPVDHRGRIPDYETVATRLSIPKVATDTFPERYAAIRKMEPTAVRYGSTGFARYIAFEFPKAVVLENYYYGNAAYVMYEDWQSLSMRTRLDLLSDPSARFERIVHNKGWQQKLEEAVDGRRGLAS